MCIHIYIYACLYVYMYVCFCLHIIVFDTSRTAQGGGGSFKDRRGEFV